MFYGLSPRSLPAKLFSGECHNAIRQQAVTWANIATDLCHYMASVGQWNNELTHNNYPIYLPHEGDMD